jgi:hypothetical protein
VQIARVEAVRVAGLGQELLGLGGIVGVRVDGHCELEVAGHEAAGQARLAQGLGVVQRLPVQRVARGQAHAAIGPGRLRVPHVEVVQIERRDAARERHLEARVALELLGLRDVQKIRQVHLAALEHRVAGIGLGHALVWLTNL